MSQPNENENRDAIDWQGLFFSEVKKMRELQRTYFSGHDPSILEAAKRAEKTVDAMIEERTTQQKRLF